MQKRTIKIIRWIITGGFFVISLMLWRFMPKKVPIHFTALTPDSFGSKNILLFLFLLNLSTCIPWHSQKISIHGNDISEEMLSLMQEDEDKKIELFHLLYAIVMSVTTLALLIAVYSNK